MTTNLDPGPKIYYESLDFELNTIWMLHTNYFWSFRKICYELILTLILTFILININFILAN